MVGLSGLHHTEVIRVEQVVSVVGWPVWPVGPGAGGHHVTPVSCSLGLSSGHKHERLNLLRVVYNLQTITFYTATKVQ